MKTALKHEQGCMHGGQPIGPPGGPDHSIPLSDRYCICDPHGDKKRAMERAFLRFQKRHVLWQEEVWYPKEGPAIFLTDMSLRYKGNVLRFLERRAPNLKAQYEMELTLSPGVQGEHALDAVDQILDETFEMLPTTWLYRTPFVLRLEQLIREGHDGPID
jgi:hypothetical protein